MLAKRLADSLNTYPQMLWTVGLRCAETKTRRVGATRENQNPKKALWKADFNRIAQSIGKSGEELVVRIGPLKLGCPTESIYAASLWLGCEARLLAQFCFSVASAKYCFEPISASGGTAIYVTHTAFPSDIHTCCATHRLVPTCTLHARRYSHSQWPQLRDLTGGLFAAACGQPISRILTSPQALCRW